MKARAICAAAAALLAMAGPSRAALLNLYPSKPDITCGFINTSYLAAADSFTAIGYASGYAADGAQQLIDNGTFSLTATNLTANDRAGVLTIGGTMGGCADPLLTGSLAAFGFSGADDGELDFLFLITGGSLASEFGGIGGRVYVPMHDTGYDGDFDDDFSQSFYLTTADVAHTPEPASVLLLCGGAALLALARRRKGRAA